jgi:hypothetical protein
VADHVAGIAVHLVPFTSAEVLGQGPVADYQKHSEALSQYPGFPENARNCGKSPFARLTPVGIARRLRACQTDGSRRAAGAQTAANHRALALTQLAETLHRR